ncbi:chorismate synthase [Desulfovibrio litoralis]|uniref:Chorismate synthase n=1 Tax=Desulfovibrio litoralis DSM 11393 TaxID=1121455 RepID=A0A1M7S6S1_9BACT|nr:chorismate synthase [Desulfovibrio litoralis]SHN54379.1 chorismate synthase [Desulfovibrio litoralis DSM 11393]
MFGSTFGHLFRLTTFGESHGVALGGVIDGCPSGIMLDENIIQTELDLRRPGTSLASTTRNEADRVEILSGVFNGMTMGTPIAFMVRNKDHKSDAYDNLKEIFRPGHADYTYTAKYHYRDHRGGGRSSGRETLSRVAGGAVAQAFLNTHDIKLQAYTVELGGIVAERIDISRSFERPYFSPDPNVLVKWNDLVTKTRGEGDSLGGVVEIVAKNVPPGLGEPVFAKLDAIIAAAIMSVGAVKGVEIGSGFAAARMKGSEHNDPITKDGFQGNNSGGILGGISSGQDIVVRAAIKPIPSISKEQETITRNGVKTSLKIEGRHDISAIPRIVPVLKAMLALSLADALLMQKRMSEI